MWLLVPPAVYVLCMCRAVASTCILWEIRSDILSHFNMACIALLNTYIAKGLCMQYACRQDRMWWLYLASSRIRRIALAIASCRMWYTLICSVRPSNWAGICYNSPIAHSHSICYLCSLAIARMLTQYQRKLHAAGFRRSTLVALHLMAVQWPESWQLKSSSFNTSCTCNPVMQRIKWRSLSLQQLAVTIVCTLLDPTELISESWNVWTYFHRRPLVFQLSLDKYWHYCTLVLDHSTSWPS